MPEKPPEAMGRLELEAAVRASRAVAVREAAVIIPTPLETIAPAAATFTPTSGWHTTEFLITAATTAFSMWVGYRVIVDPELDLNRALGALAAVVGVAWYYVKMRTEVKKASAEAGTTTIKTPGTVEGAGQNVMPMVRRNGKVAA